VFKNFFLVVLSKYGIPYNQLLRKSVWLSYQILPYWIEVEIVESPLLFLTLMGTVSIVLRLVWCWFQVRHIYHLLCWWTLLLFLVSSELLSWVSDFVKGFFYIYWEDLVGLVLISLYVLHLWSYVCWNHPCIPRMKPTWLWCMIFLMCCWILVVSILLRIFASIFIKDIGL
jgi:hypothetical protein